VIAGVLERGPATARDPASALGGDAHTRRAGALRVAWRDPASAHESDGLLVVLDGFLLGEVAGLDQVAAGWRRSGADTAERLRGAFTLLVWDEAAQAGKDPADVQIMCRINICPSTDPRAREAYRRAITAYLNVPVYREYHAWLGRGAALRPMHEAWDDGNRRGALAAVPDSIIDELGVFGTPDECRAHVERFVANGVTIPVLNFMNVETDPAKRGEESWAMLRAMAPR